MGHPTGPVIVPLCEPHRDQLFAGVIPHAELLDAAVAILAGPRPA